MSDRRALLRQIPAIDKILQNPGLASLAENCPHTLLVEAAQTTVEKLRRILLDEHAPLPDVSIDKVATQTLVKVKQLLQPSLRRVINVSGTLLHTNLGRAPLCSQALAAIDVVSRGYSNLEFDLETGQRGKRFRHVEDMVCRLTGAEAATVVNNNAGAVLLALAALASGREALVSRGELIEIGGSFRIPDIMAAGNVDLVEVGTTNKTHLDDYRRAITPETGLILKVHTSNYRIVGFTQSVSGSDLAELGHQHEIPILEDLGSGLLLDLTDYGLPPEPTVKEAIKTGVDILTFSGDKLLGGPQAGIIVGRKEYVDRLRAHPLARALRIDKMTLAALEATLRLYLDPQRALREVPTLSMLAQTKDESQERAAGLLAFLEEKLSGRAKLGTVEIQSTIGGGALPLAELSGFGIALNPTGISANQLAERLRDTQPPVVGRVRDELFIIDPRTLAKDEDLLLADALASALLPSNV
mgnify:CR=1 FL=1